MPRSTTANFDTQNAISPKSPVVLMEVDGVTRKYASGEPGGTVYVRDVFDGLDDTDLTAHTPEVGGIWQTDSGVGKLSSNELTVTSSVLRAYQSMGSADGTFQASFYNLSGSFGQIGVMFRRQDSSNYLVAEIIGGATNQLRVYRVVGGVPAGFSTSAYTPANNTIYTITVTASGTSVDADVTDGTNTASVSKTESNFQTETDHGIYGGNTVNVFTDFRAASSETLVQTRLNIKRFEADLLNIDVKNGRTLFGQARAVLLDKDLDVSQEYIVDNNIYEKDITFKLGYKELEEDDFVSLEPRKVKNVIEKSPSELEFITEDARRLIGRDAELFQFRQRTTLNGALTAAAASCTVTAHGDSFVMAPSTNIWSEIKWIWPVIIVDEREAIWYDGTTSTTFTWSAGRGSYGGTPAIAHDDGVEVKQGFIFTYIPGNDDGGPLQPLIAALLTRRASSDANTHIYYDLARYHSGFLGFGLGLTTSDVNVLSFERADAMLRSDLEDSSANQLGRFEFVHKAVNAQDWIAEYLRKLGLFVYVDRNGKLAVKNYDYVEIHNNYSADATLDNDDIEGGSVKIGFDEVLNYIELSYTQNPLTDTYETTALYKQDESDTAYGLTPNPFILKHDFFDDGINATEISNGYLRRFMYLFANPPGMFKLNVFAKNIEIAPGDFATLTIDRFKDYTGDTATRGWTSKKSLITGQRVVWVGGKPTIEIEGFTWELMDKADIDVVGTTVLAANWDDSDLDLEISTGTGNTTTRTAEDAYYDEDAIEGDLFRLEVQLTLPASPINPNNDPVSASDSHDTILFDLALHLQDTVSDPTASDVKTWQYNGIRYDAGYSGDDPNLSDVGANADGWNMVFYFTSDTGTLLFDRVKVDAFNCRYAADGRDVGSGNRADLDIVSFTRYDIGTTSISEVT